MYGRVQAVLAVAAGAALIGWTVVAPLSGVEGGLGSSACLPIGIGAAMVLVGLTLTRLRQAALWAGLLIAGHAVTLQMVAAGPTVRYQHYEFVPLLSRRDLLAFVALQAVLVGAVLWRQRRVVSSVLASLRSWQWAVIALVFALTSAAWPPPPNGLARYGLEVVFASAIQLVNLATLVLAVHAMPASALGRVRSSVGGWCDAAMWDRREAAGSWRFAAPAGALVAVACAVLAVVVYDRHPHIGDEVNYLYMARYFAAGLLSLPLPPVPEAFPVGWMDTRAGQWFSAFPPGWPAVLAIGAFWNVAWIINPVLAGLNVVLAALLTARWYGPAVARVAVVLIGVSPWWLFLGMSFMPHHASLACALGGALAVSELRRGGRLHWALLGGAATGALSLMRPLEGLIVAIGLGLWMLGIAGHRRRVVSLLAFAGACGLVAAAILPYNARLTGSATRMPLTQYADRNMGVGTNSLGFGPNLGWGWRNLDPRHGHDLADAAINANLNLSAIGVELFGWSTGSLVLAGFFLIAGRKDRPDRFVLVFSGLLIVAHSFYWFSGGPDFGARYWFLLIVPGVLLTVRGARALTDRLASVWDDAGMRVTAALVVLSVSALVNFVPWRSIDKYQHYRGMGAGVRVLQARHGFANGLVLVQGRPVPDFLSAVVYNPVDLDHGAPVYAFDRDPAVRAELLRVYGDRPIWIVEGPAVTGGGYRVAAGPLTRDQLTAD